MPRPHSRTLHRRDHKGRRLTIGLVLLTCVWPSAAAGQGTVGDDPSLDQYVESLPVPDGPRALGNRRGPSERAPAPLPPATRRELGRSDDGRQLKELASSKGLGAPGRPASGQGPTGDVRGADDESALSATIDAATDGPWALLAGGLLGALLGVAALVLVRRRRQDET